MNQNSKIVVGTSEDKPAIVFSASDAWRPFHAGKIVDEKNSAIARMLLAAQVIPSVLLAGSVAGKRLMEVVVNGELASASDGVGKRAFVIGKNGITENAKLYDASNLNALVNVSAVLNIASAVVGQKHMHDINQNLVEIKAELVSVKDFQNESLRSKISAAFDYLCEIEASLKAGERSHAVRQKLEDFAVELKAVQKHLFSDFQLHLKTKVVHTELFGTEKLYKDIKSKMDLLDTVLSSSQLVLRTQVGALQMLSLFEGGEILRQSRAENLEKDINTLREMQRQFKCAIELEIDAMNTKAEPAVRVALDVLGPQNPANSYFARSVKAMIKGESVRSVSIVNKDPEESATPRLDGRKKLLRGKLDVICENKQLDFDVVFKSCSSWNSMILRSPEKIRYLIEWENGAPLQIREVDENVQ